MRKSITVCDVCEREGQLTTYSIRTNGRTVNVDLCADDGEPIAVLIERAVGKRPKPARKRSTAKGSGGTLPVTDLDSIEATKG